MTTATLGLAVTSNAGNAAADLDRLTAAANRSEAAAKRVEKSYADAGGVMARINQMTGANNAFGGGRAADIEAYGRELDNLRSKFNPVFAAQQRFASASAEIARAQRLGAITASEAANAIMRERTALESATSALQQNTQAANENRAANAARATNGGGASSFNTANVAAQFQDIGVTAAMGMSPLMIALQQGTQLSAVLGGQGLTGVVRTLGGAFASVLSPVSLLTIAAVALSAIGLQAFGNLFQGAEDASDALERHNDWLDEVLLGYQDIRDAADGAYEAALRLPEASVTSQLGAQRDNASETLDVAMAKALELRGLFEAMAGYSLAGVLGIPSDVTEELVRANQVIAEISADSKLSRQELDLLHVTLTELGNNTADSNIRAIANEALVLVDAARSASAEVASLDAGLRGLERDVQIQISMNSSFGNAMDAINGLYQDPRSSFDRARAELKSNTEWATNTATTYGQAVAAAENYERVLGSINAAEEKANAKSTASASRSAAKPFDQWGSATANFERRIDQQRMELDLLGKSTFEIERQQAAFDLLNQAKDAGIPITSAVTDEINRMSSEYASATVELERQAKAQREFDESLQFYRSTFSGFFGDFKAGLQDGQSLWEALGNAGANALDKIADRALSMAANGIFDMLFGAVMGGITGGFGGNSLGGGWGVAGGFGKPGIFGIPGMAEGGTVGRAGLSWVGERGPELLRLPQGAEVIPNRPSMALAANGNGEMTIINHISVSAGTSPETAPALAREITLELRRQLPGAIEQHNRNPHRRVS